MKAKIAPGEVLYFRKDSLLAHGYEEKKSQKDSVLLLTTKYRADSERRRDIRADDVQAGPGRVYRNKPAAIVGYNHFMGGVDQSDMMLYAYLDELRTLKFWKKVIFSLIGRFAVNTYILYLQNTSDRPKLTRYMSTVKIVEGISRDFLDMKAMLSRSFQNWRANFCASPQHQFQANECSQRPARLYASDMRL